MLIQGDVRNLVPVKCFIKDDPEHKHKHIEFDDKVFDEDHAVNNLNLDPNPFQAGTDVSLDGDLIIQLWRDGKLDQYCRDFKFKQVLNIYHCIASKTFFSFLICPLGGGHGC